MMIYWKEYNYKLRHTRQQDDSPLLPMCKVSTLHFMCHIRSLLNEAPDARGG